MTDLEISKALALAIGWERVATVAVGVIVETGKRDDRVKSGARWLTHCRRFDYRDPTVIWPIAKAFNCFPSLVVWGKNTGKWMAFSNEHSVTANTPEKAVAMVLIGGQP